MGQKYWGDPCTKTSDQRVECIPCPDPDQPVSRWLKESQTLTVGDCQNTLAWKGLNGNREHLLAAPRHCSGCKNVGRCHLCCNNETPRVFHKSVPPRTHLCRLINGSRKSADSSRIARLQIFWSTFRPTPLDWCVNCLCRCLTCSW